MLLGLVMAATLFWMRERHPIAYGFTEVMAGLFILGQNYSNGRGGFSAGFFAEAFETFQGSVVLVTTLGAVYVPLPDQPVGAIPKEQQ